MDLRTHRLSRGITQLDMGFKIGRSQAQISLIELGYVVPDDNELSRIAEVLQVNPANIEFPERGVEDAQG